MGNFNPPVGKPRFLTEHGYSYTGSLLIAMAVPLTPIDLDGGDLFYGAMPAGDTEITLSNPRVGSFRLMVTHNLGSYAITFPTGYFTGQPGPLAYTYTLLGGVTKRTAFDMYFDGGNWYFTPILMSI